MRTFYTFFISLFSCIAAVRGQALIVDSTRFITGNSGCTQIAYTIQTTNKGILFVGCDCGNPGGIIPFFPTDTSNFQNVIVGKLDSNQQISWIKVFGGTNTDAGTSACQTPDGGYAILSGTQSNDGDIIGYKGGGDIWLLKTDSFGNLQWQKTYGSSLSDIPISIANTADKGFIILGATNGSDNDVPFHYGGFFSFDWLVVKADSVGNVQWSKTIGGTGDEQTSGTILAIDSSYYILSSTTSADNDCVDTFWHSGIYTSDDFHMLKLDSGGHVLWDSSYGGSGDDIIHTAYFDQSENAIIVAGNTYSHDYMVADQHGLGDMWVVKLSKNGTMIWEKALGSSYEDGATGICKTHNNGYLIYGNTRQPTIGVQDNWLFALNNSGDEITNKIFGGTDVEIPFSITQYLDGYLASGLSASSVFTEGTNSGRFCSNSAAFISYIDYWPLGINKVNDRSKEALIIYPNPVTDILHIQKTNNAHTACQITMTDLVGRIIYEGKMSDSEQTKCIDVRDIPAGMYCMRFQFQFRDGQTFYEKLVICK